MRGAGPHVVEAEIQGLEGELAAAILAAGQAVADGAALHVAECQGLGPGGGAEGQAKGGGPLCDPDELQVADEDVKGKRLGLKAIIRAPVSLAA